MKEDKGISLPGIGLSALLVIFAVLVLAVLALLSVSTAKAQERLSEKAREPVVSYYRADAQAHGILARLRAGELPPEVREENGVYTYTCPMGQQQYLAVEVELSGSSYRILRWQVCRGDTWEADDSLPVWDGKQKE